MNMLIPDATTFTSSRGPLRVRIDIANHAFASGLKRDTAEKILDITSRHSASLATAKGRSYHLRLKDREFFSAGSAQKQGIKIKMATNRGEAPSMTTYVEPAGEPIQQPKFRLTVEQNGAIQLVPSIPHPTGTGFLRTEVINEYTMMLKAFLAGIPTHYPIGVGQFLDMEFNGQEVGFVIMAVDDPRRDNIFGFVDGQLANVRSMSPKQISDTFAYFRKACISSARTLRNLHSAGIVHSHPHLANFMYFPNKDRSYIYDFTNAMDMNGLSRDESAVRIFNDYRGMYLTTFIFMSGLLFAQIDISPAHMKMALRKFGWPSPFYEAYCGTSLDGLQPFSGGYFLHDDINSLGHERMRKALELEYFLPYLHRLWDDRTVSGTKLREQNDEPVKIILEHADRIFQRLKKTN